jgi:hypothetical protein
MLLSDLVLLSLTPIICIQYPHTIHHSEFNVAGYDGRIFSVRHDHAFLSSNSSRRLSDLTDRSERLTG